MPAPSVKLDLQRLNELIQRKGQWIDWYKTRRCPCLDDQGYQDARCPICQGLGWARDLAKTVRSLFHEHEARREELQAGLVEAGSHAFTPPSWVRLAEGDWVVQKQFPQRTSQVVTFGAPVGSDDRVDALFPTGVIGVYARREGALVALPASCYTDPATRATINADGTLPWQPNVEGGPAPGERLSVEYYELPAWQVYRGTLPMNRGTEDRRLMDRAVVRRINRRRIPDVGVVDV